MDIAYLHLVTNHFPIIGLPLALIVLLLGIWRRSDELKSVALLAFTMLGVATVGVYLLGQGGEDFVEHLPGVSEDAIEAHERVALIALILTGITALVSLAGLVFFKGYYFLKRPRPDRMLNGEVATNPGPMMPNWLIFAVLASALISSGVLGYTGKMGGKIRHTEFYEGAAPTEDESGKGKRKADATDPAAAKPKAEKAEAAETDPPEQKESGRGRNHGGRDE